TLELLVLPPDLRLEARAVGGEAADDAPVAIGEAQHVADVHVVEATLELRADADLALPRGKTPPLDDLDVAAHLECLVRYAARHHVGHVELAAALPRDVDDDVRLGAEQRLAVRPRGDVRRRREDADRVAWNAARHLAVRPSAQQQHVVRRTRLHECGDEAVRQREHRDEHRHHESDPERGEHRRDGTLRYAADVVDERDLHSTLRSACTTGSFAACQAGNTPLAIASSTATVAPTATVPGVTWKPGRNPPSPNPVTIGRSTAAPRPSTAPVRAITAASIITRTNRRRSEKPTVFITA